MKGFGGADGMNGQLRGLSKSMAGIETSSQGLPQTI